MKKAFVISWYFPPINSSEGLVTFKLLKNSKGKYDVFTQKNRLEWTYGAGEKQLVSNSIKPIFASSGTIEGWIQEGVEYFRNHHEEYQYIMSRSMAPESHVMALQIKKEFPNIKWIASFGDPICNNPYNLFSKTSSPYSIKNKFEKGEAGYKELFNPKRIIKNRLWNYRHKRYLKRTDDEKDKIKLESNVIKNADIVILNNEYQLKHMMKTNPSLKDKVKVLYHSYDKDYYGEKKNKKDKKIHFAFIGHLDEIRTAKPFLMALKRLKDKDENLKDKITVQFYGNMSNKDKLYLVNNYLLDIVKIEKPVNYLESLNIMKNSDWLINIDANLGIYVNENIFCPAKVMDYLGSGSNIFSVTMLDGASADILRESGDIVSSHSEDEIYMYLSQIINGKLTSHKNDKYIEQFDAKNVAKKYDEMIQELK